MLVTTLRLIVITDDLRDGCGGLVARCSEAVRGGATMVQLRLKHADGRTLVEVARALVAEMPVPVVVNDRADIALAAGAAGVHVGADDIPVAALRRIVPPGFVIGASVGNEAEVANAREADYVGIGPVFATPSKLDAGDAIGLDGFERLARMAGRPAVAIGGITPANATELRSAGVSGIAVISAVLSAPGPASAARALRAAIGS